MKVFRKRVLLSMRNGIVALLIAVLAVFGCSDSSIDRAYISGLEPCDPGGESSGASAGMSGSAGSGAGGSAGSGPTCDIDDPLLIAAANGLVPHIYINGDDPGIVTQAGDRVSLWPNRTGHTPSRDFWENETAHQPFYNAADSTLDGRGTVFSDAGQTTEGKRLRELVWGPGCPDPTTCAQPGHNGMVDGPWGMIVIWKTINWTRTGNICSSEIVSTRGVHVGEVDQQIRVDNGGGTPIQLSKYTTNGQWTRLIMQYTGSPNDWACSADQCKQTNYYKGVGNATSAKRYLFGLNTASPLWNNSNAHGAMAMLLMWKGTLPLVNYEAFDPHVACQYPSIPLN